MPLISAVNNNLVVILSLLSIPIPASVTAIERLELIVSGMLNTIVFDFLFPNPNSEKPNPKS